PNTRRHSQRPRFTRFDFRSGPAEILWLATVERCAPFKTAAKLEFSLLQQAVGSEPLRSLLSITRMRSLSRDKHISLSGHAQQRRACFRLRLLLPKSRQLFPQERP